MALKDQIMADNAMFFDIEECGEPHNIELEGVEYQIPAITESEKSNLFAKQWDGINQTSLTVIFHAAAVKRAPIRGQLFVLDGVEYIVENAAVELGIVTVMLEVPSV